MYIYYNMLLESEFANAKNLAKVYREERKMRTTMRRHLGVIIAAVMMCTSLAGVAYASELDFSGVLPAWQGDATVAYGQKDRTVTDRAYIRLDSVGNSNDGANFWVDFTGTGRQEMTDVYFINTGALQEAMYYDPGTWAGTTELRARAQYWGSGTTDVSGYVNFC
jgi:hypothetical protein